MSGRERSAAGLTRLWRAGSREIRLDHPMVVGILNVTPDSFSDGGNFFSADAAVAHAGRMIEDGAEIVDVGGESTRPGAVPVDTAEEERRVIPAIAEIRKRFPEIFISIDTTKADVAVRALDAGADIVNDVSAMRLDPQMPGIAARTGCAVILMHSRGGIADMATYANAVYRDVTAEVLSELGSQILLAEEAGVDRKAIVIDPGFGFSKRSEHSMTVLRSLERFAAYDVPVMAGVSRKRFVRETLGSAPTTIEEQDAATAAVNVLALERGAMLFRVHNVKMSRRALDAAWTVLTSSD